MISILPELIDNVTKVLPVDLQVNIINNTYIKYLAENYLHIINMQKIALNILSIKVNNLQLTTGYSYLPKDIGSIVDYTSVCSRTSSFRFKSPRTALFTFGSCSSITKRLLNTPT